MLHIYRNIRYSNNINLVKYVRNYATQPILKETQREEDQLKEFEKISNIQPKFKTKEPPKAPFVKNLLLGIFDNDILTYPELKNEELNNLNKSIDEAQAYLQPELLNCSSLSKDFLKKLSSGRLLGLQASQLMGGRELTATELCRFIELLSELNLKNSIINNETLGIKTLFNYGNDYLKSKYLQKLINGDSISAFCILENLSLDLSMVKMTAKKSEDGKSWILNGEKKYLINGSDADFYVVIANNNYIISDKGRDQKFTAFVVERDFGGITSSKQKTIDSSLYLSKVVFENTVVPNENLIGEEDLGGKILSTIYPEFRLSCGVISSTLLKKLINKTTEHFINISSPPNFLHETDAIRLKLGEIATSLYAVDSMIYLTSGLIDKYDDQDVEVESAIVKVFSSEHAFQTSSKCLDLIGAEASLDEHWCNQLHKQAQCQVTLNDNNDNLKLLIALFCLRHAGMKLDSFVRKLRNPLFNSFLVLKRLWTNRKQENDNPDLNLNLHYYLHPSCLYAAKRLEYCVLRLQYATEVLFTRYGSEVINKHAELTRLAECIIDIYAMVACLGRASRSYCIGLQHAEYEIHLASAFTLLATQRIKPKLLAIIDGPYLTTDETSKVISERLFSIKEFYPVHPLTRNF